MTDRLTALIAAVDAADSANLLLEKVEDLAAARLEGAIPKLIEALGYNNPGAAVAAVDGLIQLGSQAVPRLIDQLDHHNYTARSWAIRALAGIGDPRGLKILLETTSTDMVASVRRAAARGLGRIKWHWFPTTLLDLAQSEALAVLLLVAEADDEWGVRYAAVVGLQTLAATLSPANSEQRSRILVQLERMAVQEPSKAVRARVWMAQQQLQSQTVQVGTELSPLSQQDWQVICSQLRAYRDQQLLTLSAP